MQIYYYNLSSEVVIRTHQRSPSMSSLRIDTCLRAIRISPP